MKKDELKFLYVITFLIIVIAVVLFLIVINNKNSKIVEQERTNLSLQQQLEMISKTKRESPIFKDPVNVESKRNVELTVPSNKKYIGKWKRNLMTINGVSENFSQALLEIGENSFTKTTDCSISGSLSIDDRKMIMNVEKDGCQEGKNSFVSNYVVSLDGNALTLSIDDPQFKMIEGYERVEE